MRSENLKVEKELMKQKIELSQAQPGNSANTTSMSRHKSHIDIARMAKVIPQLEGERVDSFFVMFKRTAGIENGKNMSSAMVVQQKLTGEALAGPVSELTDIGAKDYDSKKAVLLAKFSQVLKTVTHFMC